MTTRVAVTQMTASHDSEENLHTAQTLIATAQSLGAQLVCLPENFALMPVSSKSALDAAEPLGGTTISQYAQLARQHGVYLSLGGFQEQSPVPGKYYNTHVLLNPDGHLAAAYRKIHLFDADVLDHVAYHESEYCLGGNELTTVSTPLGTLGLTVCYDVRFPELFVHLRQKGAEILLTPAAFTQKTGQDHWEVLLRARAIDTQCYVVAAAQSGLHTNKRATFGHAMIVDPWGRIIAQCSAKTGVAVAEIDLDYLHQCRKQLPIMDHRRPTVYSS